MSENTAVIAALVVTVSVLLGIAYLIRAAVKERTDLMEQAIGDYPYTGGRDD